MPVEELIRQTPQIIGRWPNSYTFIKNLTERALRKFREHVPLLLIRPSIILCSASEPYPGWLDSLAAAGTLTLMVATGVTRYLVGNNSYRADLIPVDYVSNSIIAGSAWQANRDSISVLHASSSHLNPITWYGYQGHILEYSKTNPFDQQFSTPSFKFLNNHGEYQRRYWVDYVLPSKVLNKTATLIGS